MITQDLKDNLKKFIANNNSLCYGLRDWLNIKNKTFGLVDALACIYEYANGKTTIMADIIKHIVDSKKRKLQGRANTAYGVEVKHQIDIVPDANGKLELQGYHPNQELQLTGQHRGVKNPNVFKKDGTISKTYQNSEKKILNLGAAVRELFPNESNVYLTQALSAIKDYADQHKINPNRVVRYIKMNKLTLDDTDFIVKLATNESKEINRRVIVITEEAANQFKTIIEMTEYKFNEAIKLFLHDLLVDPINAKPSAVLLCNGLNRHKLITLLRNNDMLTKEEHIKDKDENGEFRKATMQVKYKVPKKNFNRKLRNLYIKLFERNLPKKDDVVTEDGSCGTMGGATSADSSGQFSEPVFSMQRRTMYNDHKEDIEEDTTTSSVGNYQYDVPFIGDKETLSRKNGVGGSISINKQ